MAQIHFFLNSSEISIDINPAITLLDFLRYEKGLVGTKIGCREGDCGACTVLLRDNQEGSYRNITSCLTPMANVTGSHVVTVEGINLEHELTQPQQFLVDTGGTQCGFCTVGFIMSFTAFAMDYDKIESDVLEWIDGNICRCTGYKSIEKAATMMKEELLELKKTTEKSKWYHVLVDNKYLPNYFNHVDQLVSGEGEPLDSSNDEIQKSVISGGTDLYVQKYDDLIELEVGFGKFKFDKYVKLEDNLIKIGSSTTASEFIESEIINREMPDLSRYFKLIASMPIRNIATFAGNIVNASPIADFVNMLLSWDAQILTTNGRIIKLDEFYLGYKQFDLDSEELITEIQIPWEKDNSDVKFNFEKVSKRTILDIASVNSSIFIKIENNLIKHCRITAGGVGPIPIYLKQTSQSLIGKELSEGILIETLPIAQEEISPISDIRGSSDYKRLLLRQLIIAHFMELFPEIGFDIRRIIA